jgi:RHS repeat-associated protein
MDEKRRIAMADTPVIKPVSNAETQLIRYQYSNHLHSALLELDDAAQVITYEEYFPYGTTSYFTIDAAREVPAKRYRYTDKERDEESGLNYHGARYYALWLCRWVSPDPAGTKDGLNLYRYVNDNPIRLMDTKGTDGDDPNNPKIDLGPPPVYESTGDQAKKDVGEVAKKTLDVVTDSPEFKKLTDPLKDKFLGPIKANLPPFIGAGIFLGVPLITSLIIIDKKLELPIAGEQRTRDLGFKAISGIGGAVLKEVTDDKIGFEIKNEEEKKYEFKVDIKPSKDLSFSGGATFADKYKVEFGVKKEFTLDPKLVAPGTISFGYKTTISEEKKPSFTFDVTTQLTPSKGIDIRIGGSLFINKEADKPGLTFPDKDDKAPVIPFAPGFSGTGFKLGVTAVF